jgi:membrane-bound metal-dependent hydrolase YbcI (DUF457 family)
MATPVGHYLVGASITALALRGRAARRQAPWWALVACAPDLDVLPGLAVGELGRFHHGASHSLAAAAMAAMLATAVLVSTGRARMLRTGALVFALYASHSVLDSFTLDTGWPIGVPFFWPWSAETYQAPWLLLPNVQHTRAPLVSVHNALLMARELLIFAPLLGLVLADRICARGRRRVATGLCAGWFVAATGLSIASLS